MRNIKLTIQYIGTTFLGWQIQPQGATIQEIFQEILREICGEPIILWGSGRTDSGVHALAQIANFKTEHSLPIEIFKRAINAKLPPEISVSAISEVPLDFDSQRDAKAKLYSYFILNSEQKLPFLSPYTWRVYGHLDFEAMRACLKMLEGEHDFAAFKAADSDAKTSRRKLLQADLQVLGLKEFATRALAPLAEGFMSVFEKPDLFEELRSDSKIVAIHLRGEGFLKHMVRNIVGTLLDVGLGRTSLKEFERIFHSLDRRQAGMTAPARGLFLMKVDYS